MKQLQLFNLDQVQGIRHPASDTRVTPRSPAAVVFTDFDVHAPVMIEAAASAIDVEGLMKRAHVKLMLVMDQQDRFIGVISLADLSEEHIIRAVAGGTSRHEIQVQDLMQQRGQLHALSYEEIHHATVQDVLNTLRGEHAQHALVLDLQSQELRGLISASDVARKLHLPLPAGAVVEFSEVSAMLLRHSEMRSYT
ncbi:MAG: CBS domain-containing protein [Pseudomonadales bacterium]|jgi:CBS domain-containing protein|nr:CBS domain-containing protein [Pseudomonadales bacterium]